MRVMRVMRVTRVNKGYESYTHMQTIRIHKTRTNTYTHDTHVA